MKQSTKLIQALLAIILCTFTGGIGGCAIGAAGAAGLAQPYRADLSGLLFLGILTGGTIAGLAAGITRARRILDQPR